MKLLNIHWRKWKLWNYKKYNGNREHKKGIKNTLVLLKMEKQYQMNWWQCRMWFRGLSILAAVDIKQELHFWRLKSSGNIYFSIQKRIRHIFQLCFCNFARQQWLSIQTNIHQLSSSLYFPRKCESFLPQIQRTYKNYTQCVTPLLGWGLSQDVIVMSMCGQYYMLYDG